MIAHKHAPSAHGAIAHSWLPERRGAPIQLPCNRRPAARGRPSFRSFFRGGSAQAQPPTRQLQSVQQHARLASNSNAQGAPHPSMVNDHQPIVAHAMHPCWLQTGGLVQVHATHRRPAGWNVFHHSTWAPCMGSPSKGVCGFNTVPCSQVCRPTWHSWQHLLARLVRGFACNLAATCATARQPTMQTAMPVVIINPGCSRPLCPSVPR